MVHYEDEERNNEKDNKKERPKKDYGLMEFCTSHSKDNS